MKLYRSGMIVAAALAAALPMTSHAADGTITFTGTIVSQTCTINGNGSGSKDFAVALPTVSASALNGAGQKAGRTPFNIQLTACSGTGNVHAYFEPGATTDAGTGNLKLNAGGADMVQIGLLNDDFSPIVMGAADVAQNSHAVSVASGTATLPYFAEYVATGVATAGAANSSVMYTLVYP
jgi:major type 1 subunit fimbrin (pilin)